MSADADAVAELRNLDDEIERNRATPTEIASVAVTDAALVDADARSREGELRLVDGESAVLRDALLVHLPQLRASLCDLGARDAVNRLDIA